MISLLPAIGLSPGGSSTVHIYTQTITQLHTNSNTFTHKQYLNTNNTFTHKQYNRNNTASIFRDKTKTPLAFFPVFPFQHWQNWYRYAFFSRKFLFITVRVPVFLCNYACKYNKRPREDSCLCFEVLFYLIRPVKIFLHFTSLCVFIA